METEILPLLTFFPIVFSLALGLFLLFRPASAIKLQIKFYAKINWRMEPISLKKEVRNTKIMGIILIATALLTFIYVFTPFFG